MISSQQAKRRGWESVKLRFHMNAGLSRIPDKRELEGENYFRLRLQVQEGEVWVVQAITTFSSNGGWFLIETYEDYMEAQRCLSWDKDIFGQLRNSP